MVKKAARQLMTEKEIFSDSFDHNKKRLSNLMPSKPIRNKIAGYIGRLVKMQKAGPRPRKIEPTVPETSTFSDRPRY